MRRSTKWQKIIKAYLQRTANYAENLHFLVQQQKINFSDETSVVDDYIDIGDDVNEFDEPIVLVSVQGERWGGMKMQKNCLY